MIHPRLNRRFVPQAVLTKSGKINIAGARVNTAVRPVNIVGSKTIVNHPRPISNAYKRDIHKSQIHLTSLQQTKIIFSIKKKEYKEKGVINSGCSRHMTGNKCYHTEYEDYDGGFVSFGDGRGRISGKCKIKTGTLDFENVYFCKELKYNLFSVSQICDKKNNIRFTDTECLVLSSDFKLLDESQVLLRVLIKDNIYSVDLKSVVPTKGLTCFFAKATIDEFNLWHRRLGHINFKNMNKLVRGNLVRGLPSKIFENDYSYVACQKGKKHKASYKAKLVNSISKPLHMLHMDLFGLTNVKSLMKKSYCLVVTDDFNHKVKVIRSDNGTEFKNSVMNQFYEMKGIKREFSIARTPQQNGVVERKNRTLIEAARTMLVDSKLPTTFCAEAVNTACYVLNRVLVIKPHNKTPYELIHGRTPLIDFMKPFGCLVTILNTRDHLGKFDGKGDEGFFVGYSVFSKAMRVFNKRTRIVEETLNIRFLENAPNVIGNRLDWLFDVDSLTKSMNYMPVAVGNQTNSIVGTRDNIVTGQAEKKIEPKQVYILIPFGITDPLISQGPKDSEEDSRIKPTEVDESGASDKDGEGDQATRNVGAEADLNNLETTMNVIPILTTIIDKDHPKDQIIGDLNSAIQTKRMTKISDEHAIDDEESNHEDASDTGAAPKQQQQVIPQTTAISNIKLPILKKEEYDIWAMEMEHYLEYIDNDVWKVIQNGNSKKRISTGKDGVIRILPPVTAAEIQAVEKERKAKNILLMAIPKEHMRRFHGMDDAKEIWEAIRTRFGGNANSKKMQKAVFKQQFEAFTISSSEGLEKGYDRFQQLLSQLEAHGAEVSTEDANHKFLRSLPPAWSNLAMTMRTKPDVDTLSIDDLYNNLRVFEQEIQGASKTSSSAQNVAFVSQSKSSTNKVKSGFTSAYSACTPSISSTNIPEKEVLAGFAD
ncbi:putative ribonuclease H-like domain-containing protein [Tanacetum coccineum]